MTVWRKAAFGCTAAICLAIFCLASALTLAGGKAGPEIGTILIAE